MMQSSDRVERARHAQHKLIAQFLSHPDVSLIDIGLAPSSTPVDEQVVLRIHVRDRWLQTHPDERVVFPTQIDGIPVITMRGDYSPE